MLSVTKVSIEFTLVILNVLLWATHKGKPEAFLLLPSNPLCVFRYLRGAVYLQQSYWPIEWGFALHSVRTPAWFSAPLGVGGIPIFETHVIYAAV